MDFDLAEVLDEAAAVRLDPSKLRWKPGASVCVVLAAGGYPGKFEKGMKIEGLTAAEQINGVKVLHAGTRRDGPSIVTNGGRVLGVTATGSTLNEAVAAVYAAATKIHFAGMHYRKDIGTHASRSQATGD